MEKYQDLLNADATIDYSKLNEEFWVGVADMMYQNHLNAREMRKSITPTHEDMSQIFNK